MSMLVDGQQTLVTDNRPTLLVLNKKDLIKPGEIAKKKEVRWTVVTCWVCGTLGVIKDQSHIFDYLFWFYVYDTRFCKKFSYLFSITMFR